MEEKQLYWKLEDNADFSGVFEDLDQIKEHVSIDFLELSPEDREQVFYTITPRYMTYAEFNALPDAY